MADKVAGHHETEGIATLADAQHGVVSAAQLYALRLSRDQVRRRVQSGWLHRVHRGVYAVGRSRLPAEGVWMAAVLAGGPGAVLSHHSAAALWRLRPDPGGAAHVTVPGESSRVRRRRVVMHRSSTLAPHETTGHRGIPVTTAARTILDLARLLPQRPLERAIDESERLRLCSREELEAIADAHGRLPGAGSLRRVLSSHRIGSTLTRSELEERFLALWQRRRLPAPMVNASLLGLTVDFLWPDARLVVELDGRRSHGTRKAFQDDRDRDSLLAAHGFVTLRFTWWDVTGRPAVVEHRIRRVLERADRKAGSG